MGLMKKIAKAFKIITLIEGIFFLTFILGSVSHAFAGKIIILDENSVEFKKLIEENPGLEKEILAEKEQEQKDLNEIENIKKTIEKEEFNTLDNEVKK